MKWFDSNTVILSDTTICIVQDNGITQFFGSPLFKKCYRNWTSPFKSKEQAIAVITEMEKELEKILKK